MFATLALSCMASLAQPVYNSCGNGPAIGTTLIGYEHRYDTVGVTEGANGANITWDFSNLTDIGFNAFSRPYVDPDSTPGSINYPNAGVAWYETSGFSYYHYLPNSIDYQGNYNGVQVCTIYSDPKIKLMCPMTFGSSFTDLSEGIQCDATPFSGSTVVTYDAYGTLILPFQTFQNTVRIHTLDTLDYLPFFLATYDTYEWWDSTLNMEILSITLQKFTGIPNIKVVHCWQVTGLLAATDNTIPAPTIRVYPNPARDQLYIDTQFELLGSQLRNSQEAQGPWTRHPKEHHVANAEKPALLRSACTQPARRRGRPRQT
jgi:hypothetical protein